jgi:hypothetical protein
MANALHALGIASSEWEMLVTRARSRVSRSPRLRPYESIIFGDWSPWPDHLRWVIRGRVSEIESWAKKIKEDSDG